MKNGTREATGNYAPETALGTGAAEPLVDEFEAAKEVPSVDESVLEETPEKRSTNQITPGATIAYSGETVAEPTSDAVSNGEDFETRNVDDETNAGAAVIKDDSEVNKPAEEIRPEVPQATKKTRAKHSA